MCKGERGKGIVVFVRCITCVWGGRGNSDLVSRLFVLVPNVYALPTGFAMYLCISAAILMIL